jgi:hypothetical protein
MRPLVLICKIRRLSKVVRQFKILMNTPKAFANFSPGLERSDNPGNENEMTMNPERVRRLANPFRVDNPIDT